MAKSAEVKVVEVSPFHAVCYVDGSAKPNPGFYGSGIHGYIYTDADKDKKSGDKPNKYTISTIGYIGDEEKAKYPDLMSVVPSFYINGYKSNSGTGTNNIGEVMAAVTAIHRLMAEETLKPLMSILLITDSAYTIHIFDNVKNDPKQSYRSKVTTNLDYWDILHNALTEAKEAGIDVKVQKIEGHSGAIGNHLSDRLAFLGRMESSRLTSDTEFVLTPAKQYWNPKSDRHPFLGFKQLFFTNTLRNSKSETFYAIMSHKKDTEPGENSHTATFGIVLLNNPPEIIEDVIRTFQTNLRTLSVISTLDLNEVYSQYHTTYYNLFKDRIYTFGSNANNLNFLEELQNPLVYAINPPGRANLALEKMMDLYKILSEYRKLGDEKLTPMYNYIDITPYFYSSDGKKVQTIVTNDETLMLIPVKIGSHDVNIPIMLGIDTLTRNQFKSIEKEGTVVTLVVRQVSETAFQYYTIVYMEKTNDLSIWCNIYSNLVFKKPA